jgi:hypothetical protein
MMTPEEKLSGRNGSWVAYDAPMTCFTEVRLSRAREHADRYGFMGLAFERQFVLERRGGPVHYAASDGNDVIVGNVHALLKTLLQGSRERDYLAMNSAFIKAMSSSTSPGSLDLLEEFEWRIVHMDQMETAGKMVATGLPKPAYRIPFGASDLKLLVFPDEQTVQLAYADPVVKAFLQGSPRPVTMLTVAQCGHL